MTKRLSIKTDPGYVLYVADNPNFAAGETPKKLYVAFAGIEYLNGGTPAWGSLMNGSYLCESFTGTIWKWTGSGLSVVTVTLDPAFTTVAAVNELGVYAFTFSGGPAEFGGPNGRDPNTAVMANGSMIIIAREPSQDFAVQQTCEDIVTGPAKQTYAEISPGQADEVVTRIIRKSDHSHIYVRRNIT